MSQPSVQADRRTTASPIARAFALAVLALGCATSAVDALAQSLQAAVGVYRPGISRFFVDGNYDLVADLSVAFGQSGDVALLGDIRGDGARHPVVFRNGQWLVDRNRDGTSELTVTFGAAGDKPLIADFDKDGIDDLVLYRNGVWYISSGGTGTATYAYGFGGGATDIPLLADIDGDGMLDLIIYRAGVWFASTRRDGVADRVFAFGGGPNDIPMAFDYNGDGIADLVIFRDGVWYVSTARNGVVNASFQLGIAGDKPLLFRQGRGEHAAPRCGAPALPGDVRPDRRGNHEGADARRRRLGRRAARSAEVDVHRDALVADRAPLQQHGSALRISELPDRELQPHGARATAPTPRASTAASATSTRTTGCRTSS